jgi:hypothetical protein
MIALSVTFDGRRIEGVTNSDGCSGIFFFSGSDRRTRRDISPSAPDVWKGELAAEKFGSDLMITAKAVTQAKKRKTTPGPSPTSKGESNP